jgi:precorrin-2 dehydrogenase / sirohydrochlorin ferrochelatase
VSGYPVLIDGRGITALVVGGGRVALRKVRDLIAAGARVRVVAPSLIDELAALERQTPNLTILRRQFDEGDIGDATLVIAATDDRPVNARVAKVARERHRLVSVIDAPAEGTFTGMAAHRSGDVVIGVSAGGVPRAAARIRDAIAERFDERYADAIATVRAVRRRLIDVGESAQWKRAMGTLLDDAFCSRVESGAFAKEADAWR